VDDTPTIAAAAAAAKIAVLTIVPSLLRALNLLHFREKRPRAAPSYGRSRAFATSGARGRNDTSGGRLAKAQHRTWMQMNGRDK
jgi:hypothetical protein